MGANGRLRKREGENTDAAPLMRNCTFSLNYAPSCWHPSKLKKQTSKLFTKEEQIMQNRWNVSQSAETQRQGIRNRPLFAAFFTDQ